MFTYPQWFENMFDRLAETYGRQWRDLTATPDLMNKHKFLWRKSLFNFYQNVIDEAINKLIDTSKSPDLDLMVRICDNLTNIQKFDSPKSTHMGRSEKASPLLEEQMIKNKNGDYAENKPKEIENGKVKFNELLSSLKSNGFGTGRFKSC